MWDLDAVDAGSTWVGFGRSGMREVIVADRKRCVWRLLKPAQSNDEKPRPPKWTGLGAGCVVAWGAGSQRVLRCGRSSEAMSGALTLRINGEPRHLCSPGRWIEAHLTA